MRIHTISEIRGASRSGGCSRQGVAARRAASVTFIAIFIGLAGCEKLPKFSELVSGKKKEETTVQAPKTAPVEQKPAPAVPAKPAPPPKTAQEVVAQFNSTPSRLRTDAQLLELSQVPGAASEFTELDLENAQSVTDRGLAALPKFERTETLKIDRCQYSNSGLANVAKMKNLTSLSMAGGPVLSPDSDQGLSYIKGMQQLVSLKVPSVRFSAAGFSNIAEMTWLESLNLHSTPFFDEHLAQMKGFEHLKELNVSNTNLSDSGFPYLRYFKELEILGIGGLKMNFRGPGLQEVGRRHWLPKLRVLGLADNPQLELSAYDGITYFKGTLELLDLGDANLDDHRFDGAVVQCTNLLQLFVHQNKGLTDNGMQKIPKLRKLKNLLISNNAGISDRSLRFLASLKALENLTINATNCTEPGVVALKKKLKNCTITFNGKKIELP